MTDIKYHLANILSVLFLSYIIAFSINQVIRFSYNDLVIPDLSKSNTRKAALKNQSKNYIESITQSGFFQLADENNAGASESSQASIGEVSNLVLLGTITGSPSITRAMIKSKSEKEARVYRLWTNIDGYKIVRISNFKVYLKTGDQVRVLDMYGIKDSGSGKKSTQIASSGKGKKGNLSRASIMQMLKGDIENISKGMVISPYRVNGKLDGFKLKKIRPNNFFYKLGARSGDILKRINGQPINSSATLLNKVQNLTKETKVVFHIDRRGQILEFDYTITD